MTQHHVNSADGTPIAYYRVGAGDPIVLVHGASASASSWLPVAGELARRFTMLSVERRGRGASGDGPAYAFEREVEDVLAVIDAAGQPVHLVGHSYGAVASLYAAAQSSAVRTLALYEPPIGLRSLRASLWTEVESLAVAGEFDLLFALFSVEGARIPDFEREVRGLLDSALPPPEQLLARISVPTQLILGAENDGAVYFDGPPRGHLRRRRVRQDRRAVREPVNRRRSGAAAVRLAAEPLIR